METEDHIQVLQNFLRGKQTRRSNDSSSSDSDAENDTGTSSNTGSSTGSSIGTPRSTASNDSALLTSPRSNLLWDHGYDVAKNELERSDERDSEWRRFSNKTDDDKLIADKCTKSQTQTKSAFVSNTSPVMCESKASASYNNDLPDLIPSSIPLLESDENVTHEYAEAFDNPPHIVEEVFTDFDLCEIPPPLPLSSPPDFNTSGVLDPDSDDNDNDLEIIETQSVQATNHDNNENSEDGDGNVSDTEMKTPLSYESDDESSSAEGDVTTEKDDSSDEGHDDQDQIELTFESLLDSTYIPPEYIDDIEAEFESILKSLNMDTEVQNTYVERFAGRRDRYGFILSPIGEAPSPTPSNLSGYSGYSGISCSSPDPFGVFRMSPAPNRGTRQELDLSSLGVKSGDIELPNDQTVPIYQTVQAKKVMIVPDGWDSGDDLLSPRSPGEWDQYDNGLSTPPVSTSAVNFTQFGTHVKGWKVPDVPIYEEPEHDGTAEVDDLNKSDLECSEAKVDQLNQSDEDGSDATVDDLNQSYEDGSDTTVNNLEQDGSVTTKDNLDHSEHEGSVTTEDNLDESEQDGSLFTGDEMNQSGQDGSVTKEDYLDQSDEESDDINESDSENDDSDTSEQGKQNIKAHTISSKEIGELSADGDLVSLENSYDSFHGYNAELADINSNVDKALDDEINEIHTRESKLLNSLQTGIDRRGESRESQTATEDDALSSSCEDAEDEYSESDNEQEQQGTTLVGMLNLVGVLHHDVENEIGVARESDKISVTEMLTPRSAILLSGGMFPEDSETTAFSSGEDTSRVVTPEPNMSSYGSGIKISQYTSGDSDDQKNSNVKYSDNGTADNQYDAASYDENDSESNKDETQPVTRHSPLDFSVLDSSFDNISLGEVKKSPRIFGRYYSDMDQDILEEVQAKCETPRSEADNKESKNVATKPLPTDEIEGSDETFKDIQFVYSPRQLTMDTNTQNSDDSETETEIPFIDTQAELNKQRVETSMKNRTSEFAVQREQVPVISTESAIQLNHEPTLQIKNEPKLKVENERTPVVSQTQKFKFQSGRSPVVYNESDLKRLTAWTPTKNRQPDIKPACHEHHIDTEEDLVSQLQKSQKTLETHSNKQVTTPLKSILKYNTTDNGVRDNDKLSTKPKDKAKGVKKPVNIKVSHLTRKDSGRGKVKRGYVHEISELFNKSVNDENVNIPVKTPKKKAKEVVEERPVGRITPNKDIILDIKRYTPVSICEELEPDGSLGFDVTPLQKVGSFENVPTANTVFERDNVQNTDTIKPNTNNTGDSDSDVDENLKQYTELIEHEIEIEECINDETNETFTDNVIQDRQKQLKDSNDLSKKIDEFDCNKSPTERRDMGATPNVIRKHTKPEHRDIKSPPNHIDDMQMKADNEMYENKCRPDLDIEIVEKRPALIKPKTGIELEAAGRSVNMSEIMWSIPWKTRKQREAEKKSKRTDTSQKGPDNPTGYLQGLISKINNPATQSLPKWKPIEHMKVSNDFSNKNDEFDWNKLPTDEERQNMGAAPNVTRKHTKTEHRDIKSPPNHFDEIQVKADNEMYKNQCRPVNIEIVEKRPALIKQNADVELEAAKPSVNMSEIMWRIPWKTRKQREAEERSKRTDSCQKGPENPTGYLHGLISKMNNLATQSLPKREPIERQTGTESGKSPQEVSPTVPRVSSEYPEAQPHKEAEGAVSNDVMSVIHEPMVHDSVDTTSNSELSSAVPANSGIHRNYEYGWEFDDPKFEIRYPSSLSRRLYGPYCRLRGIQSDESTEYDLRETTPECISPIYTQDSQSYHSTRKPLITSLVNDDKSKEEEMSGRPLLRSLDMTTPLNTQNISNEQPIYVPSFIRADGATNSTTNSQFGESYTPPDTRIPFIRQHDGFKFNTKPIINDEINRANRSFKKSENNFVSVTLPSDKPRSHLLTEARRDKQDFDFSLPTYYSNTGGNSDCNTVNSTDDLQGVKFDSIENSRKHEETGNINCADLGVDTSMVTVKNGLHQPGLGVHIPKDEPCDDTRPQDVNMNNEKLSTKGKLVTETKTDLSGINYVYCPKATYNIRSPLLMSSGNEAGDDKRLSNGDEDSAPEGEGTDTRASEVLPTSSYEHVLEDEKGELRLWPYSDFDNSDKLPVTLHRAKRGVNIPISGVMSDRPPSMTVIQSAERSTEMPENRMVQKYHTSSILPADRSSGEIMKAHGDSVQSVLIQDTNGNHVSEEELASMLPKIAESISKMENSNAEEILPGISQSISKLKSGGNLVITTMTRKLDEDESGSSGRGSPEPDHPVLNVDDLENSKIFLVQDSKGELFYVEDVTSETQESAYFSSRNTSESISETGNSPTFDRISKIQSIGRSGIKDSTAQEILANMYGDSDVREITENEEEWSERTYEYELPKKQNYSKDSFKTSYMVEEPGDTMPKLKAATTKDKYESSYKTSGGSPWVYDGGMSQSYSQVTQGVFTDDTNSMAVVPTQNVTLPPVTTIERYTLEGEAIDFPIVPVPPPPMFIPPPPLVVQTDTPQFSLVKVDVTPKRKDEGVMARIEASPKPVEPEERPIYKTVATIHTPEKLPAPMPIPPPREHKRYKIIETKATETEEEQETHMRFDEIDYKFSAENTEYRLRPTAETQYFVRNTTKLEAPSSFRSEKLIELNRQSDQKYKSEIKVQDTKPEEVYEQSSYSYDQMRSELQQSESNMRVVRGSYLIKNTLDEVDGDLDDNINMFDGNFTMCKDNPLYKSDEDIYLKIEREKQESNRLQELLRNQLNHDITFDTVDKYTRSKAVKREPEKKLSMYEILMNRLSTIDTQHVRQKIDVKHHNEDIYGDPRFMQADGKYLKNWERTNDLDTVGEKVDLMIKDGKAFITVKVTAEKYSPVDLEFNVWRKHQAVVTRTIEVDLLVTEKRRRLYYRVMDTPSSSQGNIRGGPHETILDSEQTLDLFTKILGAADGEGDVEDIEVRTRAGRMSGPISGMDLLY